MNVLIINPPWETPSGYGCRSNTRWPHIRTDKYLHFPVYLAYAASILRSAGAVVEVIDAVAQELSDQSFVRLVTQKKPDVCFIETSTPTIDEDIRNALELKKSVSCRVFLMGAHVSCFHAEIMKKHNELDGVIRGEFEMTMLDIIQGKPLHEICGLTVWTDGAVAVHADRELISDMDSLPFPAWDLFDMKAYESHLYKSPSVLIITSRGCPFNCSFCLWPDVMYGHKQRYRSASNVCDEMEKLIEVYGVREIRFDDDTFALNKDHVIGLCDEIIKRGIHNKITWTCFGHISQHDESLYKALKDAGCVRIDFGIESGSEKILKKVGKSINIEHAKKTIHLCRKHGLTVYCDFMIGFPGETEDDIKKSIEASLFLDPDYIQVSYTIPYPGTRMYKEELNNNNLLYPDQWEKYASCGPIIKNSSIPEKRLIKLYKHFWKRFYLRPWFIVRTGLKMLKSLDEIKRHLRGLLSFVRRFLLP